MANSQVSVNRTMVLWFVVLCCCCFWCCLCCCLCCCCCFKIAQCLQCSVNILIVLQFCRWEVFVVVFFSITREGSWFKSFVPFLFPFCTIPTMLLENFVIFKCDISETTPSPSFFFFFVVVVFVCLFVCLFVFCLFVFFNNGEDCWFKSAPSVFMFLFYNNTYNTI